MCLTAAADSNDDDDDDTGGGLITDLNASGDTTGGDGEGEGDGAMLIPAPAGGEARGAVNDAAVDGNNNGDTVSPIGTDVDVDVDDEEEDTNDGVDNELCDEPMPLVVVNCILTTLTGPLGRDFFSDDRIG